MFRDPKMVLLICVILLLSLTIILDKLSPWKTVSLVDGDRYTQIRSQSITIADLLQEQQIALSSLDKISPTADHNITNGMTISITRIEECLLDKPETIPFGEQVFKIGLLKKGEKILHLPGRNGQAIRTYRIRKQNNLECRREFIQRKIRTSPRDAIVFEGTGNFTKNQLQDQQFTVHITNIDSNSNKQPILHVPQGFLPSSLLIATEDGINLITKTHSDSNFSISGLRAETFRKGKMRFRIVN